jgi:DNA polymerase I-like protein with 3'-5' exonuclease and polymerase domains
MRYTLATPKRKYVLVQPKPRHLIGEPKCDLYDFRIINSWFSLDTETTGLDPWGTAGVDRTIEPARPFMATLCNEEGETACLRWPVDAFTRKVIPDRDSWAKLQELLGDASITKVMFNAAFDFRMLRLSGFTIRGPILDALMGIHTISPDEMSFGLKPICAKYLNIPEDDQRELQESVKEARRPVQGAQLAKRKGKEYDPILVQYRLSEEVAGDYFLGNEPACEKYGRLDAYRTAALHLSVAQELSQDLALTEIYARETKLGEVLRSMEDRGIRLDKDRAEELVAYYQGIKDSFSGVIRAETSQEFNPNSPKQLTEEFFGKRGYTPLRYSFNKAKKEFTKCMHCKGEGCAVCQTTGRNPSADGEFLAHVGIDHATDENGDDILVEKDRLAFALLHDAAADTMLQYVKQYLDSACLENGIWVVHPNYKQHGTKTSRLSAEKPNMQNVATDESPKKRVDIPYRTRECFIPREGFKFYIPDYSQIEVWLLFLRAKATDAINALAAGGDAHQAVATLIWGDTYDLAIARAAERKPTSELTQDEKFHLKQHKKIRKRAKNLQFCKIYGGGSAKVATMIGDGCTTEQAEEFIKQYDKRLPFVKVFMSDTIRQAKREGFIRNGYGRKFFVDKQFAYRATNYDIQGSAADLIKNAMSRCYDLSLSDRYVGKLFLLLSIHDELLFEVHESVDDEQTQRDIANCMQADYEFLGCPIPFPVGLKISSERWSITDSEVKL